MTPPSSAFVLVPGAGGNSAWFWSLVMDELRAAGHDAVAAELPSGDEDAGLEAYVETIVEAVGDRRDVTLVALSLGAFSAPIAAERVGAAALALVAPMLPAPGETPRGWWTSSGQLAAMRANDVADGRDPDAEFDEEVMFFHDIPAEVLADAPPSEQSGGPMEDPFPLAAWPQIPTRVLLGRRDRLFPYTFMVGLVRDRLGVEPDSVDAGHLTPLARPVETARWLLQS